MTTNRLHGSGPNGNGDGTRADPPVTVEQEPSGRAIAAAAARHLKQLSETGRLHELAEFRSGEILVVEGVTSCPASATSVNVNESRTAVAMAKSRQDSGVTFLQLTNMGDSFLGKFLGFRSGRP